jgi:hypothetical protein
MPEVARARERHIARARRKDPWPIGNDRALQSREAGNCAIRTAVQPSAPTKPPQVNESTEDVVNNTEPITSQI